MKLPFTEQEQWRWRWMQGIDEEPEYPLHRIASYHRGGDHDACESDEVLRGAIGVVGETVCGKAGQFAMPGIFSRMGAPRCDECCKRLGVPPGEGAPFNSDEEEVKNEPIAWLGEAWKA